MEQTQKRDGPISLCVGCGHQILDQFILRVLPDLDWHAACLKCAECDQYLDESCTCFIKDGKTLCKEDYSRLYSIKCAKCLKTFTSQDYVMRTQLNTYHVQCFRCEGCDRQLLTGDKFTIHKGYLFCTSGHQHSNGLMATSSQSPQTEVEKSAEVPDVAPSSRQREARWALGHSRPERSARVRTVLSESQLHMLRTCYSANPRPDALVKEQLVELTGLSPRVIRVWFQNKRCKDKKKSMAARQTQHRDDDEHVGKDGDSQWLAAEKTSFSTASPDSDILMSPLDFHNFQPCWKLLTSVSLLLEGERTPEQQMGSPSERSRTDCLSAANEVVPISMEEWDTPQSSGLSPAEDCE